MGNRCCLLCFLVELLANTNFHSHCILLGDTTDPTGHRSTAAPAAGVAQTTTSLPDTPTAVCGCFPFRLLLLKRLCQSDCRLQQLFIAAMRANQAEAHWSTINTRNRHTDL